MTLDPLQKLRERSAQREREADEANAQLDTAFADLSMNLAAASTSDLLAVFVAALVTERAEEIQPLADEIDLRIPPRDRKSR